MALRNLLFFFLFLLHLHSSSAQSSVKAAYWSSDSGFALTDINPTLFTHLFCAFAGLDQSNQITISPSFSTFTQTLQQKNPSLKTLLSIGGGNSMASAFASMASQSSSRKTFIDSSIKTARANNFHGLDLDWEYPSTSSDMTNLGTLFDEWRTAITSESTQTGKTPLILTAALGFSSIHDSVTYPVQSIGRSLDWVNVMAYDFQGPGWAPQATGAPASLYTPGSRFSGSAGIQAWIGAGLSSKKLVLGLPYYGRAWKLTNQQNNGVGAPANGAATGTNIDTEGAIGYKQIKSFIQQTVATQVYNATYVTNYCYSGTTWIGFDDTQSIAAKVSFAKNNNLLGYFAWQISGDNDWALSQLASQTLG
ncbi:class V chitinase-like [Tasmannia lanceolata]|uniref:class V chitinase-like n=1 Tax=Tasmannia lanceolata TaxID=3420 RepID=UPI004063B187